ncbi:MAG: PD-(D/E)XK nuclease family protein, partial [Anaerolineae bacterium]|nr:PD-(D/E)XK nuclease family protein [Anaerolineae bacterium]
HQMGALFLERFLNQIGIQDIDLDAVTVQREFQNIDIFIADNETAIILENKIYAPDQPKQLQRYYRAIKKQGFQHVIIVYLSLYGDDPGAESMGNLDDSIVTTLSYQVDIRDWLSGCLEIAEPYPVVAQTIAQYQNLVEKLTGQAQGRHLMDIKALFTNQEVLSAALAISQALHAYKIDMQFKFWVSLEEKLTAAGFDITEYWKYSKRSVEAYYNKGVRRYGILLTLPEVLDHDIIAFFVGVSHRIYYGFIPVQDGSPVSMTNDPGFELLSDILKSSDETWSSSPTMLGWRPARRVFDFYTFNSPDILALTDAGLFNTYLDELVAEMTIAIDAFFAACEADLRLYDEPEW